MRWHQNRKQLIGYLRWRAHRCTYAVLSTLGGDCSLQASFHRDFSSGTEKKTAYFYSKERLLKFFSRLGIPLIFNTIFVTCRAGVAEKTSLAPRFSFRDILAALSIFRVELAKWAIVDADGVSVCLKFAILMIYLFIFGKSAAFADFSTQSSPASNKQKWKSDSSEITGRNCSFVAFFVVVVVVVIIAFCLCIF